MKDILEAISTNSIRYAEFRIEGSHRRVIHVNPEDVSIYLKKRGESR